MTGGGLPRVLPRPAPGGGARACGATRVGGPAGMVGGDRPGPRREPATTGHSTTQRSWRRPIFPRGYPLSIFGAGELNFRVRDGNGCGLSARVTRILCVCSRDRLHYKDPPTHVRDGSALESSLLRICPRGRSTSPAAAHGWAADEVKPSTISTAKLHWSPSFHMPPTTQVISLRSYPVHPVGNLISRRASQFDAFSAYPNRT